MNAVTTALVPISVAAVALVLLLGLVNRSAGVKGLASRISPVRLPVPRSAPQGSWAEPPIRNSETNPGEAAGRRSSWASAKPAVASRRPPRAAAVERMRVLPSEAMTAPGPGAHRRAAGRGKDVGED